MNPISVGFLHHACYGLGDNRPRERHRIAELTEGYADVCELHVRYGAPASLHLSGELLTKIARYRPQFIERMRELAESGLLSFVGGAYPEVNTSDAAALGVSRFQDYLELYEREFDWPPPRVTVCFVPGRSWDPDRLPRILTSSLLPNAGFRYLVLGEQRRLGHAAPVASGRQVSVGPDVLRLEDGGAELLTPAGFELRDWIPRRDPDHWRPVDNMLELLGTNGPPAYLLYSSELERTAGVAGWGIALDHFESFLRLHAEHPAGVEFALLERWLERPAAELSSRTATAG